jgi:hypothetical protein
MNFFIQIWDFYKVCCITGMSIIFIAQILGITVEVKSLDWRSKNKE